MMLCLSACLCASSKSFSFPRILVKSLGCGNIPNYNIYIPIHVRVLSVNEEAIEFGRTACIDKHTGMNESKTNAYHVCCMFRLPNGAPHCGQDIYSQVVV